jgi:MarR family 2-MHQ and catechol resistance regulon transcriptional repressor
MTDLLRIYQFRDRDRTGYRGMTITQCYTLERLIRQGPMTLNELADAMKLQKSTVSRIVGTMVRKGFVRRERHQGDRRAVALTPTVSGRRRYFRIEADLVEENRRLLEDFSPRVRLSVIALIERLTEAAARREVERMEDET